MSSRSCQKRTWCVLGADHVRYMGIVKEGRYEGKLVEIIHGKLANYRNVYSEPNPCMSIDRAEELGRVPAHV